MVQERSRAAAVSRALAWALALVAAWLLLSLMAPPDRAAAEPLARDLGSLVGDAADDALGAVDATGQAGVVDAVAAVDAVAETVAAPAPVVEAPPAPVAPAPVAPAPAPVAPAPTPAAPDPDTTSLAESPLAPPPASDLLATESASDVVSAVADLASTADAVVAEVTPEELADVGSALVGPIAEPLSSILAPVVGLVTPIIDPALELVDEVAGPVLGSVPHPVTDTIDDLLAPPSLGGDLPLIPPVPAPGSVIPDASLTVLTAPFAESSMPRSCRTSEPIAALGDAPVAKTVVATMVGALDGPHSAAPFGPGVMPPASAGASAAASASGVLGVVSFLVPFALLRGSSRRGFDADVPTGPAREHAPSPD